MGAGEADVRGALYEIGGERLDMGSHSLETRSRVAVAVPRRRQHLGRIVRGLPEEGIRGKDGRRVASEPSNVGTIGLFFSTLR